MIVTAKLDWSIRSPQERLKCVNEVLEENPEPNAAYLELMATYLVEGKDILTENRMATINKRETSLEGLIGQFENGEDGLYNIAVEKNKHAIFKPKVSITKQDLEEIPDLRQKRDAINFWERQLKKAHGHAALIIKQTIIELRKDQYLIKDAYRRPAKFAFVTRGLPPSVQMPSHEWVSDADWVCYDGVSLCDARVISQILCNYAQLRLRAHGDFVSDTWYLLESFDTLYRNAMAKFPMYHRLAQYKMDFMENVEIQSRLLGEFGYSHSVEYLSSLWRNKIPRIIAEEARREYLLWYHTYRVKSKWKRCNRCGRIKLAHNYYFSVNKTTKDGFYSICKACRRGEH